MKNAKDIPEEKLLKLIKEGAKPSTQTPAACAPDIEITGRGKRLDLTVSFHQVKICLIVLIAGSFLLLAKAILMPVSLPLEKKETVSNKTNAVETPKTVESYLAGLSGKTVFKLTQEQTTATAVIPDLTKDVALLGIVSGDDPQAVIEDKKSGQTYYLARGQSFAEMKVTDIQENKVILEYDGKRLELHL